MSIKEGEKMNENEGGMENLIEKSRIPRSLGHELRVSE